MWAGGARETIAGDIFFGCDTMRMKTCVFAGAVAALLLLGGAAPGAYAKHAPKPQHLKPRKDMGAYGGKYMAPKKAKAADGILSKLLDRSDGVRNATPAEALSERPVRPQDQAETERPGLCPGFSVSKNRRRRDSTSSIELHRRWRSGSRGFLATSSRKVY